jgi:hypothetical protein
MTHATTTEAKMTIGIDRCEAGRKSRRGFWRSSSAASAVHVTHADRGLPAPGTLSVIHATTRVPGKARSRRMR